MRGTLKIRARRRRTTVAPKRYAQEDTVSALRQRVKSLEQRLRDVENRLQALSTKEG